LLNYARYFIILAMELKGTTAVITGSTGRLGWAIVEALALAGCNCVCHYNRNRRGAEAIVEGVVKVGGEAVAVGADLGEPDGAEALFESITEFDTPRVLINSAAVFSAGALSEVTFAAAQRVFGINLTASILTSREFAKILGARYPAADAPVGKIINLTDIGGIRPWAGYVVYCASKAGLIGATKALAKDLAPAVCVNAIAPGIITWAGDVDESEKNRQLCLIPMRRTGQRGELTEAIMFLLGSDYITGQVLNVDGGRCI